MGYSFAYPAIVAIALFLSPFSAKAQSVHPWRELTPPGARSINCLLAVGGLLYAGGDNAGVSVSTDNGQTWRTINQGLTDFNVLHLAGNEQTLLAATDRAGIFRLAADGQSWEPASAGLPSGYIDGLVAAGDVFFVSFTNALGYPTVQDFLYRSTNRGISWSRVTYARGKPGGPMCARGATFYSLYSRPSGQGDPGEIGLLRTTDGGQTWTGQQIADENFRSLNSMAANDDWLIVGGQSGAWRIPTANLSTPQFVAFPDASNFLSIDLIETGGRFIASNGAEVYASSNNGQSWAPAGLFGQEVYALAATSDSIIAGTSRGFVFANDNPFSDAVALSAASFKVAHSPASIVAIFGSDLAQSTEGASTVPLPTMLGGSTFTIRDSAGTIHQTALFFVSPNQINAELPAMVALGEAIFTINAIGGIVRSGFLNVQRVAPAIFTASSDGKGVPAAFILQISPSGAQTYIPVFRFDADQNRFTTNTVRLSPQTDSFFLVLFGTGWRGRTSLGAVDVRLNGLFQPAEYAGPSPDFVGLDQMNLRLSKTLNGAFSIRVVVNGEQANDVLIVLSQ